MYTPATKLPIVPLRIFQWARPLYPNPSLKAPSLKGNATFEFSVAPVDYTGAPITGGFLMGVQSGGYTLNCWVPPGAISGTTATGVVRGIRLDGLDYTTADTSLDADMDQESPVFCAIAPVYGYMIQSVIQGLIASGGKNFLIGDETSGDINIISQSDQTIKARIYYDESAERYRVHQGDDGPSTNLDLEFPILKGTTAELAALPELPAGGMVAYDTTLGKTVFREGGAWVQNAAGGVVADGTELVSGKWQGSTLAEMATHTDVGTTGSHLAVMNKNLVKIPSGAADENKIVVLNLLGQIPNGFANFCGEIKMWSVASPPAGWLICNGSEVSRVTYADLFSLIADTFGGGNGGTTFNLPDFRNRVPVGLDTTVKTVIDDCETNWTAGANVVSALDAVDFKTGTKSVKLTIGALASAGQILGYKIISVSNLYGKTRVGFWIKSSIALNAGDLQYKLDDTAAIASALETINIPALQAGVWTKVYLTLATPSTDLNLISHGIYQVVDKGAFTLNLDDFAYGENYEIGATGGAKTTTMAAGEMPYHIHPIAQGGGNTSGASPQLLGGAGSINSGSAGGGIAQNNMQPFMTINYIIKY